MRGRLRFRANVQKDDPCFGMIEAAGQVQVRANLQQRLRIAGILVGYDGPDRDGDPIPAIPAPTLADLINTSQLSYNMFPVAAPSAASFRVSDTFTLSTPLTDDLTPGSCTVNWDAFMSDLRDVVIADTTPDGWVFYGIMANGIPLGPVVGCGGGGLGTGSVGAQRIMAHEVGHALGLAHAPCGNPPGPDPNYPAYEPYDPAGVAQARIGEYGFDGDTLQVRQPQTRDIMSYCLDPWISLYHYQSLIGPALLDPAVGGPMAIDESPVVTIMDLQDVVNVSGYVDLDQEVQVSTVMRLRTRPVLTDGTPIRWKLELLDAEGNVLSSTRLHSYKNAPGCGCGSGGHGKEAPDEGPFVFQALVPDADATRIRIVKEGEVIWEREAPSKPPILQRVSVKCDESRQLRVKLKSKGTSDVPMKIWSRYSADKGESWQVLSTTIPDGGCDMDVSHLPEGTIMIEVLASDGFYTTRWVDEEVVVPASEEQLIILNPQPQDVLPQGGVLHLWALAEQVENVDESYVWFVNGEEVGKGQDVYVPKPDIGLHKVRLQKGSLSQEIEISVE